MSDRASKIIVDDILEDSSGLSTEATLAKILGFDIPVYDNLAITYVAAGDGTGEIETVIYYNGANLVATLTLTYNSDDKINTVTLT